MSSSGCPDVFAAAAEAEGLEAHRLEGDVAGEDHQVGPRELAAVLLLDRQQQRAGLVEVAVVGPAVERGEALGAVAGAAAAVLDAVGAGAVPRHADEEAGRSGRSRRATSPATSVISVGEVLLHRREVEGLELLGVVEVVAHGVGHRGVLVEHLQVQLIRPPVLVGRGPDRRVGGVRSVHHGASARAVVDRRGRLGRSLLLLGFVGVVRWLVMGWSVHGRSPTLAARRAAAPVDDLGFVDLEAVIVVGGEAGHLADRAVDVEHGAAASTDQVMVVVTDSILVAGRRSGRLDPADEVLVDQDAERVVHRLAGDRADDGADVVGQLVGRGVPREATARMMASRWAVTCTPCWRRS